jgi:Nucleoside 2-deoxyribosyltransferase
VPEDGSLAERIRRRCPRYLGERAGVDAQGWEMEEFGLPLNLMLAVPSAVVVGDAEAALRRLRADIDARRL